MLYYTQLIFVKDGQERVFHDFEEKVLPLLKKHGGNLIYRARPTENCVIETAVNLPYEIHIVTFDTRAGFEAYLNDNERIKFLSLKELSVAKVLLVEGKLI
jgi:uncharacterized protein (DUF1330 family)